jgi:hypothetical protein
MQFPKHWFSSYTHIIPLIGVLVLVIAVPFTIQMVFNEQDNRQQASQVGQKTCAEVGGQCQLRSVWTQSSHTFSAASVYSADYTCPTTTDQNNPYICLVQSGALNSNYTCQPPDGTCVNENSTTCKSITAQFSCGSGSICCADAASSSPSPANKSCPGQCWASDNDCAGNNPGKQCIRDTANQCLNATGQTDPGKTCYSVGVPPQCSTATDGKQYCCPSTSTKVGETDDTNCPVCQNLGESSRWSVAECSSLGGTPGSCNDPEKDCKSLPDSCKTGETAVWSCEQNAGNAGKHCAHDCTQFTP